MNPLTVRDACHAFRAQHEASPARLELIDAMLAHVCRALGDEPLATLQAERVARWRATLPPATRWQATQALKQVAAWARRWDLVERDPAANVANPRPQVAEVHPLDSWAQVEAIAAAMPEHLRLLPVLGAGCGLRPGELLGLGWECVDLERRQLQVRASVWRGALRSTLKTRRSRRAVPMRDRVVGELAKVAPARRSGLVLCSTRGTPLDLHNVRARAWKPALQRAGIVHPHRIYDLRHTYATWSLRAGVGVYQLARRMGTSVDMIDQTYGHLASDALEHELGLLDAFDGR
jgi:integrase